MLKISQDFNNKYNFPGILKCQVRSAPEYPSTRRIRNQSEIEIFLNLQMSGGNLNLKTCQ